MNLEVVTPGEIEIGEGTRLDYRLRLHGFSLSWTSLIEAWCPTASFVDRQLRGPYRYWRHQHRFAADGEGTIVEDEIRYDVPGGSLVNRWFVEPDLRRIFAHRARKMTIYFNKHASIEEKLAACPRILANRSIVRMVAMCLRLRHEPEREPHQFSPCVAFGARLRLRRWRRRQRLGPIVCDCLGAPLRVRGQDAGVEQEG